MDGDSTAPLEVTQLTGRGEAICSSGTIYNLIIGTVQTVTLTEDFDNTLTISSLEDTTPATTLKWTRDDDYSFAITDIKWVSEGTVDQTWSGTFNDGDTTDAKEVTKLTGAGEALDDMGGPVLLYHSSGYSIELTENIENTFTITDIDATK